ncbi:MAG: LacI family DNA-binding transcriptional regulator [Burkholderiales bacterium]|nr:LacI family DNA-binding transcriptional regulator [Burkholderiales bacterium]
MPSRKTSKPSRRAGLREIAEAAGLAVSTVSRALSNPGRVSVKTRKRVEAVAGRLNYAANTAARSLRSGKSHMCMLLLPKYGSSYLSLINEGVDHELLRQGYGVTVGHIDRIETTERQLFEQACSGMVDGILAIAPHFPGNSLKLLRDAGLPVVSLLMDRSELGIPSVVTDDRAATRKLTESLLQSGHRRLAYVGGPAGNYHDLQRHAGVLDALAAAGLGPRALQRLPGNFTLESGTEAAQRYLALPRRPTAVVCCNDYMAIGFMKQVQDAGLQVPRDVAITGFDGIDYCDYCTPRLSTARQPFRAMGETAARLLLELCADAPAPTPMQTVLESTPVLRESSLAAAPTS